jgi:outer membrane lipoprotein SlyB
VDAYLDWYYSLVGEYTRILNMLTGELRAYMREKLVQYLQKGAKVQEINRKMEQALAQHEQVMEEYEQIREQILAQRRIKEPQEEYKVVRQGSLEEAMAPLSQEDAIAFRTRMGASGAATLMVSSLVAKKVLTKKSAKIAIKMGAKKLAKVVTSKAASSAGGTAAGAAVGGTIGSLIPGPGTAVGAAVGGVAGGFLLGVSVDALLLEVEEAVSREEFKAKLMQAIEQTRQEMKRSLSVPENEL